MPLLQPMNRGSAYLKAGFLGFPKSGKTWTAALLAIGTRHLFKLDGPIAIFDTEGGTDYIGPMLETQTGKPIMRIKSRVFDDLMAVGRECIETGVSVLIVDSITHIWRELMDAYLKRLNESLVAKGRQPRTRFELQDIMRIKELWSVWPNFYLNSPLHILICGRAGFEWDMVENEDTGKKELTKTGVKMKVESEFGFEPSLLVEMERVQNIAGTGPRLVHQATVLGDRFGIIDAAVGVNPTFQFFKPHVELLLGGDHAPTKVDVASTPSVDDDGNTEWAREKKNRIILSEEIQGFLVKHWPSQSADDKRAKADMVDTVFHTRSWTQVENLPSKELRAGLERMRGLTTTREDQV